jgi:hypothetical protein
MVTASCQLVLSWAKSAQSGSTARNPADLSQYGAVMKDAYESCLPKRTCVYLSPLVYLQRKGGGKKDHSPNHIQAKLRAMPDCMTVINLNGTNSAQ